MVFFQQIKQLFVGLTKRQKIVIAAAALGVLAGLASFLQWREDSSYQTLYSGLAEEDAAQVVNRLKESGAEYRLEDGGKIIKVRAERIADLRLTMAASGVPKSGRMGFELFDQNHFGATQFAEQVNFHRALEGELERSVMTLGEVEGARVHITPAKDSLFVEQQQPAKASVLLRLKMGARPSAQNVQAITHLVASAVEGLSPDMVSVLDARGNLLNRARRVSLDDSGAPSDAVVEYRRTIERDLLAKINNTLEPLLGPEKFRAGVSVDCDLSTTEQSEESFDPTRSVMAQSQRTEDVAGANQASGVPGVASNLPRPTSRPGSSGNGLTRRTENIAYQSSRLVKRTNTPRGQVRRVSVSVLLDHNVRYTGTGPKTRRVIEPPSPERLKATRELVAGAIGFQEQRGDQLIVEALPFESTLTFEPPQAAPAPAPSGPLPAINWAIDAGKANPAVAAGVGGGALLALLIGGGLYWFVRRRGARKKKAAAASAARELAGADQKAIEAGAAESKIQRQLNDNQALKEKQELEMLSALKMPDGSTKKSDVLTKHMAEQVKESPAMFAQIVRTWMSDAAN